MDVFSRSALYGQFVGNGTPLAQIYAGALELRLPLSDAQLAYYLSSY